MIFYGEAKYGHRIHMGNFVVAGRGNDKDWVWAFCGADMETWEEGERPPASKAADFCKNCFRAYAWNLMLAVVLHGAGGLPVPEVEEHKAHIPSGHDADGRVVSIRRAG